MSSDSDNGIKFPWIKIKIFTKTIWTIARYLGRKSVCLENQLEKNKAGIWREVGNTGTQKTESWKEKKKLAAF